MAPPIPGLTRAPLRPRRTAGDVLAGIFAVIALAALTGGVPLGLITFIGLPLPHSRPRVSLLTHQLDTHAMLTVLAVVVWLAWLQLVICVIAEIRAAVRNAGMPARVPLSGGTQALAHRLVTAALVLFTSTVALSPAITAHAPPRAPAVATATAARPAPPLAGLEAGLAESGHVLAPDAAVPHAEKIYVVKPPAGRYHESLWEIAQKHLGDGRRYGEIYRLNKDRVQPDGSKLTIASLIRPGWVLHMPRDAHGPGIEVVRPAVPGAGLAADGPVSTSGPTAGVYPHGAEAGPAAPGLPGELAGTGQATHPAGSVPPAGPGHHQSGPAGPGGPSGPGRGHPVLRPAAPAPSAPGVPWLPAELFAASLLASGVLQALGKRRREQLWQRAFGRRLAGPAGDAACAEAALRLGAGDRAARLLDAGLRSLPAALARQGKVPPAIFAVHLGEENLDLWIAPGDPAPPAPWLAMSEGQVWRLPLSEAIRLDPGTSGALAPYPGLVSIGTDDAGRVLVDLEAAHGLIGVTGPDETVQAALAAMAVELATNRWSDRMELTLVGFGAELALLAPDRVTAVATLAEALPGLEQRADQARRALAKAGLDSVLTGRSLTMQPDAWAPHYLITAVPPGPGERDRLLALARTRHRTATGYLVAGLTDGATWTWEVTGSGRLRAPLLGFDVAAQLLPARQYAAVAGLFAATQAAAIGLDHPDLDAVPAAQLLPGAVLPVEVTLLGPVAVRAPGVIEPDRCAQATEIVAFLAAHPGGVHRTVLTGAIWPRGVTDEVRDAALARTAAWLGSGPAGPHLITGADGRLALGPQVRVDWQVFRALVARAGPGASPGVAPDGQQPVPGGTAGLPGEADWLARAMDEVQGQLLDGRDPGRYGWLATDPLEYEASALVADTAHRLSRLRLAAGDSDGAMAAARRGLRLAFSDELLWRDLLTAAHASGDESMLRDVVAEVSARAALDEVLPRMAPETEALIDEILPSWRSSVA
ncbi:MAG TPA: hypothetical protein VGQ05_14120 [Streptosporangiaceae bacterium]|nr:hypothetical protein [Streptosporangiaceae bacterium]